MEKNKSIIFCLFCHLISTKLLKKLSMQINLFQPLANEIISYWKTYPTYFTSPDIFYIDEIEGATQKNESS